MNRIHQLFKLVVIAIAFSLVPLIYTPSALAQTTPPMAQAIVKSTSDPAQVMGTVKFTQTPTGMQIVADIDNAPLGTHGFHIHEFGSCQDAGKAAGGHFNPDGVKHGDLVKDGLTSAHPGDLGNISVASNGDGGKNVTVPGLTFHGNKYAIAGRAVIVHDQADDFGQPTGHAGGRIGCGAIALVGS